MQEVLKAFEDSHRPLVCGHVKPDPDCIGSMLVMSTALRGMGKAAGLLLPENTVGRRYHFMPEMVNPPGLVNEPDLIVTLDTAMLKRINKPKEYHLPDVPICNIDHHLGNERFGRFNWVDTAAASTCQMVFFLLREMGITLTAEQATLLYAGLHTDTCGFSLSSTDYTTLTAGAELARGGAKIGWVCQKLHRSLHLNEFKLMRVVYDNMQISPCGRFAWSTVTYQELNAVGAEPRDIDDQVAVPRSIGGIKIAAFFSESKSGVIRINLRAEDDINILPLARSFGGGGHAQAAGAIMEGSLEQVVDRVKQLSIAYLDKVKEKVV
ncbi:MAG: DHH family phosphoesterase [Phycisphaerae bacterium]